jgi:hypothetical protein
MKSFFCKIFRVPESRAKAEGIASKREAQEPHSWKMFANRTVSVALDLDLQIVQAENLLFFWNFCSACDELLLTKRMLCEAEKKLEQIESSLEATLDENEDLKKRNANISLKMDEKWVILPLQTKIRLQNFKITPTRATKRATILQLLFKNVVVVPSMKETFFRSRKLNCLFYELQTLQQKDYEAAEMIRKQGDTIEELYNDLEKLKKPTPKKTIRLSTSRMDGTPGRLSSNDENHWTLIWGHLVNDNFS